MSHYRWDSLTKPLIIIPFMTLWPKGHGGPRNEIVSLSPAEHQVGFGPGPFQFKCDTLIQKPTFP